MPRRGRGFKIDHAHERLVRNARWVAARRTGETVVSIAKREGVHRTVVSRITSPHGPCPRSRSNVDPETATRWVLLRRAGFSATKIAAAEGVTVARVRWVTARAGPFEARHSPRLAGLMGLSDLRELTRATQVVYAWWEHGLLPEPTTFTSTGRPLWERAVLEHWADDNLTTCPICDTRTLDIARHRGARHPEN